MRLQLYPLTSGGCSKWDECVGRFCLPTVGMAHRLRYEPQQRILTLSKSTELEILNLSNSIGLKPSKSGELEITGNKKATFAEWL